MKTFLRILLAILAFGLFYFFFFVAKSIDKKRNTSELKSMPNVTGKAKTLHPTLTIADWHADPLLWDRNLLQRNKYGHIDIPRLIEGNVTLQVFAAVTKSPSGQNYNSNESDAFDNITPLAIGNRWPIRTWNSLFERAIYQSYKLNKFSKYSKGRLSVISSKKELEDLILAHKKDPQKVGGLLAIEGMHAIEGDLGKLDELYNAGYRVFGLTHFFDNKAGGSSAGVSKEGLSDFGKSVISAIEKKSGIIDLAHASPQLISDVMSVVSRPIVVSHTGVKAINNSPRNLSDDQILAIASNGGLIGVGYWPEATGDISPTGIVKTIRYIVDLVGINYVSLGSDFDGSVHTYFDVSQLILLTEALIDDGFTDEEIAKIMGGNQVEFLLKYLPE